MLNDYCLNSEEAQMYVLESAVAVGHSQITTLTFTQEFYEAAMRLEQLKMIKIYTRTQYAGHRFSGGRITFICTLKGIFINYLNTQRKNRLWNI